MCRVVAGLRFRAPQESAWGRCCDEITTSHSGCARVRIVRRWLLRLLEHEPFSIGLRFLDALYDDSGTVSELPRHVDALYERAVLACTFRGRSFLQRAPLAAATLLDAIACGSPLLQNR